MSKFQSISLPTLSDSATMKEVENESRKMGLDILNKINTVADSSYPVGATYTQYSGQTAPATLFGGTWTDITATSLPTQVYDSGSNYIRYTDGNMQCWGGGTTAALGLNTGATIGSGTWWFYFGVTTITYGTPVSFVSTPSVTTSGDGAVMNAQNITTSGFNLVPYSYINIAQQYKWQAIGKWSSAPVYPVTLWKRTGGSLTTTTGTSQVTGIYDSGTNSNGSWIRYSDGTMMQWGTTATVSWGASTSTNQTITFNIQWADSTYAFTATPVPITTFTGVSYAGAGSRLVGSIVATVQNGVTAQTGFIIWQSVGRWK
jgi:hypothetical protein